MSTVGVVALSIFLRGEDPAVYGGRASEPPTLMLSEHSDGITDTNDSRYLRVTGAEPPAPTGG